MELEKDSKVSQLNLSGDTQAEEAIDIGHNVKCMRELRGWSQIELSRKSGLSRTTIRRIEEGMPCWRPTLERLADSFNIPLNEFCRTNRFQNTLDDSKQSVIHRHGQHFWHARGDRRNSIPEKNEELIQSSAERERLGKLGFVPAFVSLMEYYLPLGPGVMRVEIYDRHEQRFMPQYTVLALLMLHGTMNVSIGDTHYELNEGDSIAFHSSFSLIMEPTKKYLGGRPCEFLLSGSQRKKVP